MKHELKTAWRNLMKYKVQNLVSIVGLAVGLLSFSICLYCSRYVESMDACFRNHRRLARLELYRSGEQVAGTPAGLSIDLRKIAWQEAEAVSCVSYPRERDYYVESGDNKRLPYNLNTFETDSLYYRLFAPEIIAGNWQVAARTPNAIVLTESAARRMFGEAAAAIGRPMTLARRLYTSPASTPRQGGIVYTVQAVMGDLPANTSLSFFDKIDMLTLNDSEGLIGNPGEQDRTGAQTFVLLAPGKKSVDFENRLAAMPYTYLLFGENNTVQVFPMSRKEKKAMHSIALLTGVVGLLVLLSGLLNFFHFQTGSFLNRTREYSIRKVTGGNGYFLFRLLFTQALLVLVFAFLLLLCLVELVRPYLLQVSLIGFDLAVDPGLLMWHALQYMVVLVVVCAGICLATTVRIMRISVQTGLRGGTGQRAGRRWLRNGMLGVQFFICWLFVSFTLAFYLQSEKTADTLFPTLSRQEKASIFSLPMDYDFLNNTEKLELVRRIGGFSGIRETLLADVNYVGGGASGTSMYGEQGNPDTYFEANLLCVPPNFFSFMHIPLVRGKGAETGSQLLVDRVFADRQDEDVLGKTYYDNQGGYTVCGVTGSFCTDVYSRLNPGYVFLPFDSTVYIGHYYVKCVPGSEAEVRARLYGYLREVLPESVTPRISTLLNDIREAQPMENHFQRIILFFSLVSLVITLLGVYSAVTLDTERRQKEVAIRKINGAGIGRIIYLFARLYVVLLAVTALLAFPVVGLALTYWKQAYVVFFRYGFLFWAGLFVFVAAITACTVMFRILRIARLNPAEVIKNE